MFKIRGMRCTFVRFAKADVEVMNLRVEEHVLVHRVAVPFGAGHVPVETVVSSNHWLAGTLVAVTRCAFFQHQPRPASWQR